MHNVTEELIQLYEDISFLNPNFDDVIEGMKSRHHFTPEFKEFLKEEEARIKEEMEEDNKMQSQSIH